jgi:microtubule-associated protein-like 6
MTQKGAEGSDQLSCHRNDVLCLDCSPDRTKIVTGQEGKYPSVHVWDAVTGEKIKAFQLDKDSRGVFAAAISVCNRYVAAVDDSDKHRVFIYNLERDCIVLQMESGSTEMKHLEWSHRPDDLRFAILGEKQIQFWNPADVTKKLKQVGIFGQKFEQTPFHSLTFDSEGWCYSGGENGQIQVWGTEGAVVRCIKAHSAAVTTIQATGNKLISGGRDGKISLIQIGKDATFKLEMQFDIHSIPSLAHLPKDYPISVDMFEGNVIVGLRNGSIVEKKQKKDVEVITQSHWDGECWGLNVLDNDRVITSCDDNRVIMYDIKNKKFMQETVIGKNKQKEGKN